jgi:hypothetical protein
MTTPEGLPPHMAIALSAAVPLWVFEMSRVPLTTLIAQAPELSQVIAEKGDVAQFKSKKKGETAAAFNAIARALAVLSFMPGGVTFLGEHYENKHPDTKS